MTGPVCPRVVALRWHRGDTEGPDPPRTSLGHFFVFSLPSFLLSKDFPPPILRFPSSALLQLCLWRVGRDRSGLSWEKRDREFHENSVENSQPKAELDSCAGHGGIHRDGIPRASVAAPSLELSQARKMGIVSQFYPKPFQDSGMLT